MELSDREVLMRDRRVRHLGFLVLAALLASVSVVLSATPVESRDIRARGMGAVGVSLSGAHSAMFANPAALYFRGKEHDTSFYVSTGYGDNIVPFAVQTGQPCAFLQKPVLGLDLSFAGRNLALTIKLDNQLENRTPGVSSAMYNAYYYSLIQIDLAFGYRNFGIGAFLRGGNRSVRENIVISGNNSFLDYLTQSLFERYSAVEGSEFFNIGLGLQLNYDWVSMGVCTETLVMARGAESVVFSGNGIFSTLTCGISFRTPTYTRDNQLSMVVLESACDFYHLGDDETRAVHIGAELMFQLLPSWSVSLRTGYVETKPKLTQMFTFVADNVRQTFGLGAALDKFNVDFVCEVPVRWYLGTESPTDSILCSFSVSFTV